MTAGPVRIWGLPLVPWTRERAADAVMELIEAGRPAYFITANTHYAMVSHHDPRVQAVNEKAAFLLADGAPLVIASRWSGTPLPERVAGSDLIYDLAQRAGSRGYRLYLLGGEPGVAKDAARRLQERYPGLIIAGTTCPDADQLHGSGLPTLLAEVRAARPDLLMIALGQPKGELWIAEHLEALGVPACVQVGATLDFVAGRIRRAPLWAQRIHLEWAYRMWREPGRLAPRYARNAWFLIGMVTRDLIHGLRSRLSGRRARCADEPVKPDYSRGLGGPGA